MFKKILQVAALAMPLATYGATFCSGKVQTLGINPGNGAVQVSIGYGVHYMCSVSNPAYNAIDIQACRSWYAMLMTAKASGKSISMAYDTTNQCNQMGNWVMPNPLPYWVEIVD